MSYADQVFIQNCKDILSKGVWDTDRPVRPRWEDGTPAHTIKTFGVVNRYNLKGTFNINSDLLGKAGELIRNDRKVRHDKIQICDFRKVYDGHEVAVHTLTHPNLTTLDEKEIIRQVEEDRIKLSELCGYEVVGMAYPCGGVNNDDRVAEVIKNNTGVKYSRTITSVYNFDLQNNLFRFNPSVYYYEKEKSQVNS